MVGKRILSEEVVKVIEIGTALGLDFHGQEDLVAEEINRKEKEEELRINEARVIKSLGGSLLTKGIGVDSVGAAGGVITLWNENCFEVKSCISNERCIIVAGVIISTKKEMVFCTLYAANIESERIDLWNFILNAQGSLPGPWVIGGDFNTVLVQSERMGGASSVRSMRNFKQFVDSAYVVDIPMVGMTFTWSNFRENGSSARLDRFLCDPFFLSWYPNLVQKGLCRSLSDHNPVIIGEPAVDWGPRPFRFRNGWLEDKALMEEVKQCWKKKLSYGSAGTLLIHKMKAVKSNLKLKTKGDKRVEDQIKVLEKELEDVEDLEANFTVEEVWAALSECDGNKALGPDGFNLNFIKANWEFIKDDYMKFLSEFYNDGLVVSNLNCIFIALIPKTRMPESLGEYRPISLVGSLYKILAKILANRLKLVMNSVISLNQMAFVKDRQILDSFIIAEEVIHSWKKEGVGGFLIKLDF
ncbi:hypothetical protein Dsin_022475 [Dipteronia sinensis]|uniref:Reverse transcriptase domain-containing protein n=1 Tax=Dipteronia sinensis TaxID=43782 RepID=A0AAE0DZT1_9ROSI|nr:hypothetical protein Dsin_022475 [Dipteronia sinensis]